MNTLYVELSRFILLDYSSSNFVHNAPPNEPSMTVRTILAVLFMLAAIRNQYRIIGNRSNYGDHL
ncbi:MAG: hypothetical protein JWN12_350 [Candidatus Saccharibacteria bacterium]|nr:hypothetical protein [Candidatus Saccharibacteria bacterium]